MRRVLPVVIAAALLAAACNGSMSTSEPATSQGRATTITLAPPTSTAPLPTASAILADGEITDEERELARQAVFACIVEAGADTTFELFDIDPVVQRDYPDEYQDCLWPYVGISRRNEVPDDQFDLLLLGVVECAEDQTGKDYGPKTVDPIGRLTAASRETILQAIDQDELVYEDCLVLVRSWDVTVRERSADGAGGVGRVEGDNRVPATVTGYQFDGGDPKRLSLQLDACGYVYGAYLIEETDTTVTVEAITITQGDGQPCWIRHPIRLKHPLGDRDIIDGTTGQQVPPRHS